VNGVGGRSKTANGILEGGADMPCEYEDNGDEIQVYSEDVLWDVELRDTIYCYVRAFGDTIDKDKWDKDWEGLIHATFEKIRDNKINGQGDRFVNEGLIQPEITDIADFSPLHNATHLHTCPHCGDEIQHKGIMCNLDDLYCDACVRAAKWRIFEEQGTH